MQLQTLCVILALVCAIAEVARGGRWPNVRLLALSFVFYFLSLLISGSMKTP